MITTYERERKKVTESYKQDFNKYGYSPEAVKWSKKKQGIRFEILTSQFDFENKSILDIGCGFGDLNRYIGKKTKDYEYLGIDVVDDFISTAKKKYETDTIRFEKGDFLEKSFHRKFDFIIESGIFNFKLSNMDNFKLVKSTIDKAMELCNEGIAFNFLTERVNFMDEEMFYINPEKVLSMAYEHSSNLMIRSDYMPFDYTIFVYKDDSYLNEEAVFNQYKKYKGRNINGN